MLSPSPASYISIPLPVFPFNYTFFCASPNPRMLFSSLWFFAHRFSSFVFLRISVFHKSLSHSVHLSPVAFIELSHKILLYYGTGPSFLLSTSHTYIPVTSFAKGCHSVTIRKVVKCVHESQFGGPYQVFLQRYLPPPRAPKMISLSCLRDAVVP